MDDGATLEQRRGCSVVPCGPRVRGSHCMQNDTNETLHNKNTGEKAECSTAKVVSFIRIRDSSRRIWASTDRSCERQCSDRRNKCHCHIATGHPTSPCHSKKQRPNTQNTVEQGVCSPGRPRPPTKVPSSPRAPRFQTERRSLLPPGPIVISMQIRKRRRNQTSQVQCDM